MKRLLTFSVLFIAFLSHGQHEVFHENFDLPSGADSVVTGSIGSASWNDTNFVYVSPTQSFHLQGAPGNTVFFETTAFSTVGKPHVVLEFKHIAKVAPMNNMMIKVSIDNGSTWSTLGSNSYQGGSSAFSSSFNSSSYPGDWVLTDPSAVPDNSWWKKETFDLTDIVSDVSSSSGFPNVKVRFEGTFHNSAAISTGWFVDDIIVRAAACELTPPDISFDYQRTPCYEPNPQGSVITVPSNTYYVGAEVIDPGTYSSGVDSVAIFYRINGGPLTGANMPQQPAGEYRISISAQQGDIVEYYIIAVDQGCPNVARSPSSGFYEFTIIPALPSKCGSGNCGNAPEMISSSPWKEDFEGSHWVEGDPNGSSPRGTIPQFPNGAWVTSPPYAVGDHGWTVSTGSTPTLLTGPAGDHTTGQGKYMHTEFTPLNSPTGVTTLHTPCIDLRDSVVRLFSFYYHMYGQDINGLRLDIDTGSNASAWWTNYFTILQPQHGSSTDPWKQATISLEPFIGQVIKIRFTAFALAGTSDRQDIALDDLLLQVATPNDLALANITSPGSGTCEPINNHPVSIDVVNRGQASPATIPVAYQLNNGPVVRDTFSANNLALMDTAHITFTQSLSASPTSAHSLKVWVEPAIDNNRGNDTMEIHIPIKHNAVIDNFPYYFGFENATPATAGGYGSLNEVAWNLDTAGTGSGARWTIASGIYNNSLDGPLQGLGKDKNFLLLRDDNTTATDEATFMSNCIDLSTMNAPKLNFQYYLQNGQVMELMIKRVGDPWETLQLINGSNAERRFQSHSVSLSSYAGEQVQLGFKVGFALPGSDLTAALDQIVIQEDVFDDFVLLAVSDSIHLLREGSNLLPALQVHSTGDGSVDYGVRLIQKCGGNTTADVSTTIPSWSGSSNNAPSLNFPTNLSAGKYEYKVWLHNTTDQVAANDTLYGETEVLPTRTAPYFQDFESCQKDFSAVGSNMQWEVDTPAKQGFTAHSGTNSAITNADGAYTSNDPWEYLYSPVFTGLDTIAGAELRFWQHYRFGGGSGVVEVKQSGTWENLTTTAFEGNNWSRLMLSSSKGMAFKGNSPGWIYSGYPLDSVNGPEVQFRFAAIAQGSPGWAIDDFELYIPAQNSSAPQWLIFQNGLPKPGANNISLRLGNTGARDLQNVRVSVYMNGTQVFTEQQGMAALDPGREHILQLQNTLNMSVGRSEIMVVTTRPNQREDDIPADDTLIMNVNIPHTVTSTPYCNDFENDTSFISLDLETLMLDSLWQNTDPSKVSFSPARSGTRAWVTGRSVMYPAFTNGALYTPPFEINAGKCYKFSFWHQYDTEYNFDGGNVEYSLDSGGTWMVLGAYDDTAWYNTPYVQSLDNIKPGFSGNSGGWTESWTIQEFDTTGVIRFRFRFASNASINGEGWAIDDICWEELNERCEPVSSGLADQERLRDAINLFPNPAADELHFSFEKAAAQTSAAVPMSIIDQSGRIVKQWEQELQAGRHSTISIADLPKGIYSLKVEFEAEHVVKRFIKM